MKKTAMLVSTNGYEISHQMFENVKQAQQRMIQEYEKYIPGEWLEDSKKLSYISELNATLYDNFENVYVWQVIDLIEEC